MRSRIPHFVALPEAVVELRGELGAIEQAEAALEMTRAEILGMVRDSETVRRLEAPTHRWFKYYTGNPGNFQWMVFHAARPVAHVGFEETDRSASCALVVNPALRKRGYAREPRGMLRRPETSGLRTMEARVEPDNEAGLHLVRSLEFAEGRTDADGFIGDVPEAVGLDDLSE